MRLTNKQSIPYTGVPDRPLRERVMEAGISAVARAWSVVGLVALGVNMSTGKNRTVSLRELPAEGEPVYSHLETMRKAEEVRRSSGLGDLAVQVAPEATTIIEAVITNLPQPTPAIDPALRPAA